MQLPAIGELNRRATFSSIAHLPNANSGFDAQSVNSFTAWAKLEVIGGSQYWGSMQINETTSHRVWVRRIDGKTRPQDLQRIQYIEIEGIRYRIKRVTDANDAHRFTLIEAEALGEI